MAGDLSTDTAILLLLADLQRTVESLRADNAALRAAIENVTPPTNTPPC